MPLVSNQLVLDNKVPTMAIKPLVELPVTQFTFSTMVPPLVVLLVEPLETSNKDLLPKVPKPQVLPLDSPKVNKDLLTLAVELTLEPASTKPLATTVNKPYWLPKKKPVPVPLPLLATALLLPNMAELKLLKAPMLPKVKEPTLKVPKVSPKVVATATTEVMAATESTQPQLLCTPLLVSLVTMLDSLAMVSSETLLVPVSLDVVQDSVVTH